MIPSRLTILLVVALPAALRAQDNGLSIQPDAKFAVAQSLCGEWRGDEVLNKRLGGAGKVAQIEFRADTDFVGKIPAATAAKLREMQLRLYQQGTMVMDGVSHPYVLTVIDGNPMVVGFRERGGDPLGDTEQFLVAIARGAKAAADVLMLGGDHAEVPMRAFSRKAAATPKLEPAAVLTHMAQLMEANKVQEFVETYAAPDDMKRMLERGMTMEKLVERFDEKRRAELVEVLQEAAKQEPTFNEARDEVSWANGTGKGPSELKLKLIDGRWYLKDR